MKCPLCGKGELVTECRELTYEYRGRKTAFPQQGEYCTNCGEAIFTCDQGDTYLAEVNRFRAQVDLEPLAPLEIRRIRKKLKLTQREAGEIFGGGIRAFSQYERGESRPLKSTDTLLRLLDRHPDLLAEITGKKAA
jgi:HTH-type transcriptional regulator / antitoxin MqsA